MNVKNEEVERDVRDLARRTGLGVTEAIGFAVRAALARQVKRDTPDLKRIMNILDEIREAAGPPVEEPGTFLYGDDGLPA